MKPITKHWDTTKVGGLLAILSLSGAYSVAAQGGSNQIRSEDVVNRPGGAVKPPSETASGGSLGTSAATSAKRKNVTYRSSRPFTKVAPATMSYEELGITIWRLQKADGSKELVQEGEETQLEQIESGSALTIGSSVRIGVEALTRDGFLYVIDREQFADGSYGAARLIFPTLKTRNGNNGVRIHELILIPRPPSYFRINPSKTGKTQTAEVLTFMLSPTSLELPRPITDKPMTLNDATFNDWERRWSAPMNVLEMNGGGGTRSSPKAQAEGAKSLDQEGEERQDLTQDDPLPQTIYRTAIKKGNPLLVTVPLRFS